MKKCPACIKFVDDDEARLCQYCGTTLLDTQTSPDALADTLPLEKKANLDGQEVNVLEAKRSSQSIHAELLPLLREGQQLERRIPDIMYEPIRSLYFKYLTWSEQVERSLRLYLDESYIGRFHAQDEQAGTTWTGQLRGRVIELEKIVREFVE